MNYSLQAERSVLGAIMLNNEVMDDVFELLGFQHFYSDVHQSLFSLMVRLSHRGPVVDLVTVHAEIQLLELDIDLQYLDNIIVNTPGSANVMAYAQIVYDTAVEREMQRIADSVKDILHEPITTQEKIDCLEAQISKLSSSKRTTGPVRVDACVPALIDAVEYRNQQNGVIGLTTGLTDLDHQIGGFEPGDVIIIAGTPGAGKTALTMNIVDHAVLALGKTALTFSLEMPKQQLLMRSLSALAQVPFSFIKHGQLNAQQYSHISRASSKLKNIDHYIDDESGLSLLQIRARARKVHRLTPLDLIVIDYLQLLSGQGKDANERLEKITPGLKSLAKELAVPVIVLSQLNREGAKRRPMISDLRGSGSIEQDADTIIMLWQTGDQDTLMPTVEAIVGKHRNGPVGSVWLAFDKPYLKFKNSSKPGYTAPRQSRGFDG